MTDIPDGSARHQRIWREVARIPHGRVASYGQVAQRAGLGRLARHVGWALAALPRDSDLPWHRVINAQGRISFPPHSARYREQRRRLIAEGVVFRRGVVDLARHGLRPGFRPGSDPSPLLD